jgi:predicted MPP superfamily phosphohydrolase
MISPASEHNHQHLAFLHTLTLVTGPVSRLVFLAVLLSCIVLPASAQGAGNVTYSIVHLSDTQNLATYFPDTYNLTFSYLESRKALYNISAIIITGDLVNTWDKKKEWDVYSRARNQTTIPVYVIAGNHDADSGKNYRYYTLYTGEPKGSYVTTVGDFDLVGIDYADKTVSPGEFSRIRAILANSSRSNAIIATHWYMNKDSTRSPLGNDIDKSLIVKPSLVLTGHLHADFVKQRNVSGFPVVEDMTNYQNGLPGGNGDKNYSAGMLYTVTSVNGQVEKIMAQVMHIYPESSMKNATTVFERGMPVPETPSPVSASAECSTGDLYCWMQALIEQGQGLFRP